MARIDYIYNNLVAQVLLEGQSYIDKSRDKEILEIPHHSLDIDVTKGFPLLTSKRVYWKAVIHELIWFLSGSQDITYLQQNNVHIWDKDAHNFEGGTHVGRIYGAQWRGFQGVRNRVDQIRKMVESLKSGELFNRRQIVTAWNPAELDDMALPPCHWAFQVIPTKGGFGIKWHQRSCDVFLGIPFNIASYATLGKLLELEVGIPFTRLIGDLSCVHLYGPHIPLAEKQLQRTPYGTEAQLVIRDFEDMLSMDISQFSVKNYRHHEPIKAEMYAHK